MQPCRRGGKFTQELPSMAEYPQIFRVRQTFERPRVEDIPGEVEAQ